MATFGEDESINNAQAVLNAGLYRASPAGSGVEKTLPESPIIIPTGDEILAAPKGAFDPAAGKRCISKSELLQRLQFRAYDGPIATGIGANYNFTYAASDVVPRGKYWEVLYASANLYGATPNQNPILFLLFPGAPIPPNVGSPYARVPLFSQSAAQCNGLPIITPFGMRVDRMTGADINMGAGVTAPYEQNLLRDGVPLLVPPGCALLVYNGGDYPGGGVVAGQIGLKIAFTELDLSEEGPGS